MKNVFLLFLAVLFWLLPCGALLAGEDGDPAQNGDLENIEQYRSRAGERERLAREPESMGVIRQSLREGTDSIKAFFQRANSGHQSFLGRGGLRYRAKLVLQGVGDGVLGPVCIALRVYTRLRQLRAASGLRFGFVLYLPRGTTPEGYYTLAYALSSLLAAAALIAIGSKRSRRGFSYVGFVYLVNLLVFLVVLILSIPD